MAEYDVGIVGAGNMAEAVVRGVTGSGFVPRERIVVSDPAPNRRKLFTNDLGVAAVADNAVPASCPRVLLAVKPQMMPEVLADIAPAVQSEAVVVSIAAGVTTAFLDKGLKGKGRIVRVMPNTPMLVAAGMSALAAGPRATDEDVRWAEKLFAVSGKTCIVQEAMIDAVTAVSGSGPAYFFYLIEAMIVAGVAEGLPPEIAATLANQTCAGAARLLAESGEAPERLRAKVTSPGGTTQRAIETMEQAGVKEALVRAIRAAAERSRELGK